MEHPIRTALEVIRGKWKPLILWHLQKGSLRFGELNKLMPKISRKMLTQQLRDLEQDGLVLRTVYKEVPPKVEYALTPYGKDLDSILKLLYDWGESRNKKEKRD